MKKYLILLLLCLGCCISCKELKETRDIYFINKSDCMIEYQVSFSNIASSDSMYFCCEGLFHSHLLKDSIWKKRNYGYGWEYYLGNHTKIRILVMDGEIFNEYRNEPCDTIRKYVPVLHRYQLTLEDLQRMNWVVVYPPEE